MSDWVFSFGVPGGAYSAAALFALLVVAVVLGAVQLRGERRAMRRRVLLALRIGTALLAWVVAVQPRWVAERVEESEGRLAVLVDVSRSMALPRSDTSRAERTRALMERWHGDGRAASVFTFGEALEGADLGALAERVDPVADESGLGSALSVLLGQDGGHDLGGVVVVSDGAGRTGVDLSRLRAAGVRIHTVAVGEENLRDDAIAEVQADPIGFLRRPARVRVLVRSLGGPGGPIPVTLRRGDEVVREVIVDVPANGEAEVEIPFTPTRLGREVYRVSIPRVVDDAVPENDERAFLVRVTRDKLRVLLVAGQPSWDERFLRSFLKRDPATDLISFFILRNTSDRTMAGPDELALIPFPTDELFNEHLGSFDLVVFQNFEYGPYQMGAYLPRIRDYVLRGGSFAMVGGPLSFHSGGYAGTPIAEILPVNLPPQGTPASRTVVTDRFRPRIPEGMARHPLLSLVSDPVQNTSAWARLSELQGANIVAGARPDAAVLLEHPEHRSDGGGPLPLLVLGSAGEGRTMALTTDTTWRWGISTGGATGDASGYERFWDRAVRWLTRDPSLEPARVTTDRERYGTGARARISAHLRDSRYAPHAEESVSLRLVDMGGHEVGAAETRTDREGRAEVALDLPTVPGAYRVEARLSGRDDALCDEWLVVEEGGDELADPRANPDALEGIAEATAGRFYASPDAAPSLDEVDTTRTRSLGTAERAPFDGAWAFLLLAAAFVGEWVLRRRWGRR